MPYVPLFLFRAADAYEWCMYIHIYIYSNIRRIYIINNWEIPNVTRKGGSKYRAHQGNGTIWKMFLFSVVSFCSQKIYTYIYSKRLRDRIYIYIRAQHHVLWMDVVWLWEDFILDCFILIISFHLTFWFKDPTIKDLFARCFILEDGGRCVPHRDKHEWHCWQSLSWHRLWSQSPHGVPLGCPFWWGWDMD